MKKIILFLTLATGLTINGQVMVDTVFTTTEEISFVSDDGGGTYTVSGPGAGSDGFLAIYDEGADSWEYKNFPPRTDLGSVHDADVNTAYTLGNGVTIASGLVANSTTSSWGAIRRYDVGSSSFSNEVTTYNAAIGILPPINGEVYATVWINQGSGGYAWNLSNGSYLVKINPQDLSLEWSYAFSGGYDIASSDVLISTAKVYRNAIQALPNGNIAVTVGNSNGYELWEFNPTTGQKIGVIDDSYTDYDRDGTEELQYRFHRWKVVDGVLYHEFWNDPSAYPDDQNVGHWEKLEVPGYTPDGGSGQTAGGPTWSPAQLQVTAVSDFNIHDSFGYLPKDFWVDSEGKVRWEGVHLSENLALYKVERMYANISDVMDEWVAPTGERMVMTRHSLIRVTYNEMFSSHIQVAVGNNVTEAHNNEVYTGGWKPVYGEGTVVVDHSAMPQVGDSPDSSWWTIPLGFHYVGETPIAESHDQATNGLLYFYVDAIRDGENVDANEMLLRIWVIDANTVGVPETEISGLRLYPNPVQDFLTVEADMDVDAVRIYNMSGIMVKEAGGGVHSVFVGDLPTGVYIVEITAGEAVSRRVVVKR